MQSVLKELEKCNFKKPWTKTWKLSEFDKELIIHNEWYLPYNHKKRRIHQISVSIGDCSVGGILEPKNSIPWGKTGFGDSQLPKDFYKDQYCVDIGFECKTNDKGKLSYLVFYLFFYLLKVLSRDILITCTDNAEKDGQNIAEYVLKNIKTQDFMNTNFFYYERFGFIYPRKYEYLSSYLKHKDLSILSSKGLPQCYLKLNSVSFKTLKSKIENQ